MDHDEKAPRTSRYSKKLEFKIAKIKNKKSRKWSEEEIETLLACIQKYGHTAFSELQERLPNKSLETIKGYLFAAKTKSKQLPTNRILDNWLNSCHSINKKENCQKWEDSIQIAQVIKFLSVDGLLESHPLPENCSGIDFPSAYRLLSQALMGHPLQPVNKATADFITETIGALILDVTSQLQCKNTLNNLVTHLTKNFNGSNDKMIDNVPSTSSVNLLQKSNEKFDIKKPIKTYQRKKRVQEVDGNPVLNLNVTPTTLETTTGSSSVQCYAVSVEGSSECSLVDVPVPEMGINDEGKKWLEELHKSPSYNPFQVPQELLKFR